MSIYFQCKKLLRNRHLLWDLSKQTSFIYCSVVPLVTKTHYIRNSTSNLSSVLSDKAFLSLNSSVDGSFARHFHSKTKSNQFDKKKFGFLGYISISIGAGILLYTTYYIFNFVNKKPLKQIQYSAIDDGEHSYLLPSHVGSHHPVSRKVTTESDKTGLELTLYQFQTCPFCCKVRAFLDYKGFSYNVVEVNSVTRSQTKWSDYRKVPFLVVGHKNSKDVYQLKDSAMIISALQSLLVNKSENFQNVLKSYPAAFITENGKKKLDILNKYNIMYGQEEASFTTETVLEERQWRKWVDEIFVHVLSPNVYRSPSEAFQSFKWFSQAGNWDQIFSAWEKYLVLFVGSSAMYFIGKHLKKKYKLKDDVRSSLYDETNVWLSAVNQKGKFLGGDEPNIADLEVYGILTAIEGCGAFNDLLTNTNTGHWFYTMKELVNKHSGSDAVTKCAITL